MTVAASRPNTLTQLTEWVAHRCAESTGKEPKQSGDSWSLRCPAHEDRTPSLSVSPGTHPDGAVVIHCHAGCNPDDILQAANLDRRDLFIPTDLPYIPEPTVITTPSPSPPAAYTYLDADGQPIGQVVRTADKKFWRKKPDGNGGWTNGGFGNPLYNLPAVLDAIEQGRMVCIVEGEKDVDNLAQLGIVATCNAGGAGKWTDDHTGWLNRADVTILPDNDQPGEQHATDIAQSLLTRDNGTVRIVRLPGLPDKGDVSDWIAAGHDQSDLARHVTATAPLRPGDDTDPADTVDNQWQPVDLTDILTGDYEQPTPTVLTRTDGNSLLYAGRTHSFYGPPESGKTWIVLAAAAETLAIGLHVLMLDFENSAPDVVNKLRLLGADDEAIGRQFHYIQPGRPLDDADAEQLARLVDTTPLGLAIIDGVTNVMGMHGLDDNQGADVAQFDRMLVRPLKRGGAAAATVDHTAKNPGDANRYAIGSQHKLAAIDGAAFLIKADRQQPFAPGRRGTAQIVIAKDRAGGVRAHSAGNDAGMFVLDSSGDLLEAYIDPPDTGPFRPTMYMERVSEYLADCAGTPTVRQLQDEVTGKNDVIAAAVKCLIEEGHVEVDRTSQGHFHRLVKPFVELPPL